MGNTCGNSPTHERPMNRHERPFLLIAEEGRRSLRSRLERSDYLRAYWQQTVQPELRREAEATLASQGTSRSGTATRLAFAWQLTNEDLYAQAACQRLEPLCGEAPTSMLSTGSRLVQLATVLSWLGNWPGLNEARVTRAEKLIADMAEAALRHFRWLPYGRLELNRGENWDAQVLAGLGIGACFLKEHPRSEEWLNQVESSTEAWLDRRQGDGALCEGTINYHLYSLWNMTHLADVLREHGRRDFFQHDGLRKMFEFLVYTLAPDGRVPGFNDSERTNLQKRNSSDTLLLKGAAEYGDPMYLWAYQRVREDLPDYYECFPYVLLYYPDRREAAPPSGCASRVFPHIGWVSLRSGWDRDSTHLVMKAGPWGGWHDHLDRSTFELVGKGVPLAVDAGCGSYADRMDWFRRTESHNVVLIDGQNQCAGHGRILRSFLSDVADYAVVDCRRALLRPDGGSSRGYLRHVLYDKRSDWFLFRDSISGAESCQWLLHSRGELETVGQRAIWTTEEGVRLSARFLMPDVAIRAKSGPASFLTEYGADPVDVQYIAAEPRSSDFEFAVLLEPLAAGQQPIRLEAIDRGGRYVFHTQYGTSYVNLMSQGHEEPGAELQLDGVAALVNTRSGRLDRLFMAGATRAGFRGQSLFETTSRTDVALQGFDGDELTGQLHVWGELKEKPVLTCDGLAASIFEERSSATVTEVKLHVPWEPSEVLLDESPVRFSFDRGEGAALFDVDGTGPALSLSIR